MFVVAKNHVGQNFGMSQNVGVGKKTWCCLNFGVSLNWPGFKDSATDITFFGIWCVALEEVAERNFRFLSLTETDL